MTCCCKECKFYSNENRTGCTVCRHLKSTMLHNITVAAFISIWMIALQYEPGFSWCGCVCCEAPLSVPAATVVAVPRSCFHSEKQDYSHDCFWTFLVPVVPTVRGLLKKQTEQNVAIFHLLSVRVRKLIAATP